MLCERQQSLALLALLYDKEKAGDLFSLFPAQASELSTWIKPWLDYSPELRKNKVLKRLKRLERGVFDTLLPEIHPDWIAKTLSAEPPQLLRVLGRVLPRGMVNSPQETPPLLNPELLSVLEEKFSRSLGARLERSASPLFPLLKLPIEKWRALFREVASTELAMAFYGLKKSAYKAVFHRLQLEDAKRIAAMISQFASHEVPLDTTSRERARLHLMSLDVDKIKPDALLTVFGMYLFSKAIYRNRDFGVAQSVAQKFPLKEGEELLAFMRRHRDINVRSTVRIYQKRFLEARERACG